MTVLAQIQRRAACDVAFGNEIRTALARGGLPAAADVAQSHGFDVPALQPNGDELSDLELELVAGGKEVVGAMYAPMVWGSIGRALGAG
ncbi:MAG: hypothetical protein RIC55_11400 [Pirellulaceae bacterium]